VTNPRWILDLCGGTGAWSKPYRDAGYKVTVVDPLADDVADGGNFRGTLAEYIAFCEADARDHGEQHMGLRGVVHSILFAFPCTEFSGSGARWWAAKDADGRTAAAIQVVRQGLAIIDAAAPAWWAAENPAGRVRRLVPDLGPVRYSFHPCDHGDPYTKRTQLYGRFAIPARTPVEPTLNKLDGKGRQSSPIHRAAPGPDRWRIRAATPPGFAKAFFEANP
jgi:hypothetical protein